MAAGDALPFPKKGVAYRVTFPILDADGDLVTSAAGLDSEISKDGGSFADCTNEATEIATASGMYYLDLTASEMAADAVAIIVKTSTAGAKTTPLVMYPIEDGDLPVNLTQWRGTQPNSLFVGCVQTELQYWKGLAPTGLVTNRVRAVVDLGLGATGILAGGAAGSVTLGATAQALDDFYNGQVIVIFDTTGIGQARLIVDYVGSSKVASIVPNWVTTPNATYTYLILAQGPSDVETWARGMPNALQSGRMDSYVGAVADGVLTAAKFATGAFDAVLTRALSAVEGSAPFRSLAGAIAKLVNRVGIGGNTLTVYKTDDAAPLGTQTISRDSDAEPIVGVDTD